MSELTELRDRMRDFTERRDWAKFHDPKSLILALVGEVGELAELFQWLPAEEAVDRARAEPLRARVGEELADVLI
jgi:dCTP diphosphatase